MKKNVLALSIAAMIGGFGFAGAASAALNVTESGTGHILLVPYYSAQNGNMTVMHVVNTDTVKGKAVKVRFRGASNSDDVLDFQVFMSPGDVWTAAVTAGADGVANLVTSDGTCTLPAIAKGVAVPFVLDRLPPAMTAADKANNTREGYVEIFNMADIDNASTYQVSGAPNGTLGRSALFTATKHVNGVAPCTSSVLEGTTSLTVANAPASGLLAPTSGLSGSWYIVNVPQTTTYSGAAVAVNATTPTNIVFSGQTTGTPELATADPLFVTGVLAVQKYDLPDLSTSYEVATGAPTSQAAANTQASNLSASLAKTAVINQYANDASISAKTDWVFSMPTRRYGIAANYKAPIGAGVLTTSTFNAASSADKAAAYRIINDGVTGYFSVASRTSVNAIGQICTSASSVEFSDREETTRRAGAVFSPGTATTTSLCGEVSVLSFADAGASALGASVARSNVTGVYTNGWGNIGFTAPISVLGAAFMKLSNPNATPGVSGNYGITWPHAYINAVE